jgi:hypothetical protein
MRMLQAEAAAVAAQHARERQALSAQYSTLASAKAELEAALQQQQSHAHELHAALARKTMEMSDALRTSKEEHRQALLDVNSQWHAKLSAAGEARSEQVAALQVRLWPPEYCTP